MVMESAQMTRDALNPGGPGGAVANGVVTGRLLTQPQKAAAVMLSLPKDKAARIMAHLSEIEVEQLTLEIATLRRIPPSELQSVMEEFHAETVASEHLVAGGVDFAREILREIHGAAADDIVDRLLATVRTTPFHFLQTHEPAEVLQHLRDENPQTLALILSYLPTRFASQLLSGFETHLQGTVARRVATLGRTSPDVVMKVERALQRRFGDVRRRSDSNAGGVKDLAALLNEADRSTEKAILASLDEEDPALAQEVRALMFVFEDIVQLDDRQVQELLRHVEIKNLSLALKGVPEAVSDHITKNLSERGKISLVEETDMLGPTPKRDVEAAQTEIVSTIRRLEDEGTITISRGGGDESEML
jgi:flagellar motor switch protein FliG